MWPADALWEFAFQLVTLGGILVAWARARRGTGTTPPWRVPRLAVEPRALRLVLALGLAALFTMSGWLAQAASLGVAQTLAMALGGPTADEIQSCRRTLAFAGPVNPGLRCLHGGEVSELPTGGWTCDKHGAPPPPR